MTEIKDTHEGMVRSLLSGQWVSKEDYQNVPYAVMYSRCIFLCNYYRIIYIYFFSCKLSNNKNYCQYWNSCHKWKYNKLDSGSSFTLFFHYLHPLVQKIVKAYEDYESRQNRRTKSLVKDKESENKKENTTKRRGRQNDN